MQLKKIIFNEYTWKITLENSSDTLAESVMDSYPERQSVGHGFVYLWEVVQFVSETIEEMDLDQLDLNPRIIAPV